LGSAFYRERDLPRRENVNNGKDMGALLVLFLRFVLHQQKSNTFRPVLVSKARRATNLRALHNPKFYQKNLKFSCKIKHYYYF